MKKDAKDILVNKITGDKIIGIKENAVDKVENLVIVAVGGEKILVP